MITIISSVLFRILSLHILAYMFPCLCTIGASSRWPTGRTNEKPIKLSNTYQKNDVRSISFPRNNWHVPMSPGRHHVGIGIEGRADSTKTRWKAKGCFAGVSGGFAEPGEGVALKGSRPVISTQGNVDTWPPMILTLPTTIRRAHFQARSGHYG